MIGDSRSQEGIDWSSDEQPFPCPPFQHSPPPLPSPSSVSPCSQSVRLGWAVSAVAKEVHSPIHSSIIARSSTCRMPTRKDPCFASAPCEVRRWRMQICAMTTGVSQFGSFTRTAPSLIERTRHWKAPLDPHAPHHTWRNFPTAQPRKRKNRRPNETFYGGSCGFSSASLI